MRFLVLVGCLVLGSTSIARADVGLTVMVNTTNVACQSGATGAASAVIDGGVGPFQYLWSTGATTASVTNLAAGSYTVTVTDLNDDAQVTEPFIITEPAALTATLASSVNPACHGETSGQAEFNPAGGTAPYTYLWSNAATTKRATGLAAGVYSVVITDANGCELTKMQTIQEPAQLTVSVSNVVQTDCMTPKGSFQATSSGGTPFTSFSWSGGLGSGATKTNVSPGTYTVTAADANNCQATADVTLNAIPTITASIDSKTNVACHSGSTGLATATASGGDSDYSYSWSNGSQTATATSLVAGTYTVTVTDGGGCSDMASVTITEPAMALDAFIAASDNVSCNGGTDGFAEASATGGTGAYTYSWSPGGATTAAISNRPADTYTVTVTDANGCEDTATAELTQPAALAAPTVGATPNPATEGDDVTLSASGAGAASYAWTGPNDFTSSVAGPVLSDVTQDAAGIYTVTYDVGSCTSPSAQVLLLVSAPEPADAGTDASTDMDGAVSDGGADADVDDASVDDASVGDASTDGATPGGDASVNADGGTGGFLGDHFAGGGGCAVGQRSPGSAASAALFLLGLAAVLRRRRR